MNKIMNFLNGHKTWIGATMMVVGTIGLPFVTIPAQVATLLLYGGTALGGAGIAHKAIKAAEELKAAK